MVLSRDELMGWLRYDRDSGVFYWKKRPSNCRYIGDQAGHRKRNGCCEIELCGEVYQAHRLVWLFEYGEWPKYYVRHINGDRSDNRIANLSSLPNKEHILRRAKSHPPITASRLRELVEYDPERGLFTWRSGRSKFQEWLTGKVAGTLANGYTSIILDGKKYSAHRLVWLYVYGRWPIDQIDHVDGDRSNNRFSNLREADHQKNEANKPLRKDNSSGFKGVQFHPQTGKWRARITFNKVQLHLGLFTSPEAAHAAYVIAAKKYFGEFARAA